MSTLFSYFKPTQEKKDKTKDAKNITPSSKTKHNVTSELSRSALSPLATTNQTPSRHQRGDSPGEDSEDEIGTTGKVCNRMGVALMQWGCGHQAIIRRIRRVDSNASQP